uniref:hypothetical protein n=1 Tax=uncultured Micrococcus sp. TaxID=114051 RepID=UPI00261CD506|nr:hypothetical protein [uncultured Micrococcus sp.]
MTGHMLEPRLSSSDARRLREELIDSDSQSVFRHELLTEMLAQPRVFPPTGGVQADEADLLELRELCLEADGAARASADPAAMWDLEVGRILYGYAKERVGEFGSPAVWDFLTLVLLPDIVAFRLDPSPSASKGPSRSSLTARLTGGNRRHVLQRLWRRWHVFGPDLVLTRGLLEDDYVALLERGVTSDRPALARAVGEHIVSLEMASGKRRGYTRLFMRRLVVASGFIVVPADEGSQVVAMIEHLHAETMARMVADAEADSSAGGPQPSVDASSAVDQARSGRRKQGLLRRLLNGA